MHSCGTAEEKQFGEIFIAVQGSSVQPPLRSFWCRACISYSSAQQRTVSQHRNISVVTVFRIFFKDFAWLLNLTKPRNFALNNLYLQCNARGKEEQRTDATCSSSFTSQPQLLQCKSQIILPTLRAMSHLDPEVRVKKTPLSPAG